MFQQRCVVSHQFSTIYDVSDDMMRKAYISVEAGCSDAHGPYRISERIVCL